MAEETIPCPGCKAPLSRTVEVCAQCRRPSSESDFAAAREAVLAAKSRRTRRVKAVVSSLFLPACVAALLVRREDALRLYGAARAEVTRRLDEVSRPAEPGKPLSPQAKALLGAMSKAVPLPDAPAAAPPPAAPPPAPRPPRVARRPEAPAEPAAGMVRVFGVVYDLDTAAPVAGAALRFQGFGRNAWGTAADADGYFTLDIPAPFFDEAILASVTAGGYREGQLEDSPSPYFERPAEMRRAVIEQLAPSDLEPLPVRSRQNLVPLDVVLVPKDLAPVKAAPAP